MTTLADPSQDFVDSVPEPERTDSPGRKQSQGSPLNMFNWFNFDNQGDSEHESTNHSEEAETPTAVAPGFGSDPMVVTPEKKPSTKSSTLDEPVSYVVDDQVSDSDDEDVAPREADSWRQLGKNIVAGIFLAMFATILMERIFPAVMEYMKTASEEEAMLDMEEEEPIVTLLKRADAVQKVASKGVQRLDTLLKGPGKLAIVMLYFGGVHLALSGVLASTSFAGLGMLFGKSLPPPPPPQNLLQKVFGFFKKKL